MIEGEWLEDEDGLCAYLSSFFARIAVLVH